MTEYSLFNLSPTELREFHPYCQITESSACEIYHHLSTEHSNCLSACSICDFTVDEYTRESLVHHFKSKWHVTNLRRQVRGLESISENDFLLESTKMTDIHDEDININEPGVSNDLHNWISRRYKKYQLYVRNGQVYSLPRAFVRNATDLYLTRTQNLKVALFVLSGGDFAAACFEGPKMILHKTQHNYVVRRKQGGVQSARDNVQSQNAPKSAGANLRREGEKKLRLAIENIIVEWCDWLDRCDVILLRVNVNFLDLFQDVARRSSTPKNETRTILQMMKAENSRIHKVPLNVRSGATLKLVQEIYDEMCKIKCHGLIEQFEEEAIAKANTKRSQKCKQKKRADELPYSDDRDKSSDTATSTSETDSESSEKLDADRNTVESNDKIDNLLLKLYTYIMSGNYVKLIQFIEECAGKHQQLYELIRSHKFGRGENTCLHTAVKSGNRQIVEYLLTLGCDPNVKNAEGKSPIKLAQTPEIRYLLKPPKQEFDEKLNEKNIDEKEQEKRRAKKQRQREKEKQKKKEQYEEKQKQLETQRWASLTDREKRAEIAERRLKSNQSLCDNCGASLNGMIPFEYSTYKFCTTSCVIAHRKATL